MLGSRHRHALPSLAALVFLSFQSHAAPTLTLEKVLGNPAFRHAEDLIDVVALPDGKRFLTSANDGSVRLWEIETGKELRRYIHDNTGYIWDIFLLPEGKKFLTASGSGRQVTEWDIASGSSNVLAIMTNTVFRTAQSPDGALLAIGTANGCVLWDIKNSKIKGSFALGESRDEDAYSVCFLNAGTQIMAGFDNHGAVVKNIADMTTLHELPKDCDGVFSLSPSPDGKMVLACTAKKGVLCLDTTNFTTKWSALADKSSIYSAAWAPDGSRIAVSCGTDLGDSTAYAFYVIDPANGLTLYSKIVNTHQAHYGITFSVDGKQIFCGSGNVLARFDSETGKRIFPDGGEGEFSNVGRSWIAAPPDLKESLLTKKSGTGLQLLNRSTGERSGVWHDELKFDQMDISPDGKLIAAAGSSRIFVIDLETDKTGTVIDAPESIRSLTFAEGNKSLIARSYRGASLYRVPSGRQIDLNERMKDLRIGNTASQLTGPLFAFSAEALINVIDTRTRDLIGSMSLPKDVGALTFFPADGSAILASSSSNLYLWSVTSDNAARPEKQIKKAVDALGSGKFKDREEATEFLISQGALALDAIVLADMSDPEVKDRVTRIKTSIISQNIYGKSSHILPTAFRGFSSLRMHPTLPYWIGLTSHPSDTQVVIGDIYDDKIRVLFSIEDQHSPCYLSFGADNTIYTANRNGTISIYRLID